MRTTTTGGGFPTAADTAGTINVWRVDATGAYRVWNAPTAYLDEQAYSLLRMSQGSDRPDRPSRRVDLSGAPATRR